MFFAKNVRDRKDKPSEDYYVRLCSGNPYIINIEAEVYVGPALWMVLELHTPLMSDKEEFDKNFGQDGERSNSFSRDLIEGVKFLHSRRIAHLDIKPDNLVFDSKKNRLVLIDFDVAFQCEDLEDTADGPRGTTGWSAPEALHPVSSGRFIAIRADLWSCGKVVDFFNPGDPQLLELAQKLTNEDPMRRPMLETFSSQVPTTVDLCKTQPKRKERADSFCNDSTKKRIRPNTDSALFC